MLRGEKVGLRARHEDDGAILQSEMYDDVLNHSRASGRPWVPVPVPSASPTGPYALTDRGDTIAQFSVVRLSDGELAGSAQLWGIDRHNRGAHLGIGLRPSFRGRGLGTDVVRVLCHYGFTVLGLHRLGLDTLADNQAMRRAAVAAGFEVEGTLRRSAWVHGAFIDEVIFGMLAEDWAAIGSPAG